MAVVRRELQQTQLALPVTTVPRRHRASVDRAPGVARGSSRLLSGLSSLIVIGLALWLAYTVVGDAITWAGQKADDLRYGYPRTYQTDGYVGYGETPGTPSHFVAMNLHGQISVIIVNGGDPAHVRVLRGPALLGQGQDLVVPFLRLTDVNHDGHADLVLRVSDQDVTYLNVPATHSFQLARGANASAAGTVAGGHGG